MTTSVPDPVPVDAEPVPARARQVSGLRGHPVVGALSPSRASDFLTCPLLYRFRAIDRLPERPGLAAFRGTLVHEVLDRLFGLPAQSRTPEAAALLAPESYEALLAQDPDLAFALVPEAQWPAPEPPEIPQSARDSLLDEAASLLRTYFSLEDPASFDPLHREQLVEVALDDEFLLRGYVDRMDEAVGGLRVVDYKTGRSPGQAWEQSAMFQLRFYGLIVRRSTGQVPSQLQLLYLGNGEILSYEPDLEDLERFEKKLRALWSAITRAAATGDWRARSSKKCQWCAHQQICPEFGGTPPPLPDSAAGADSNTVEA